MRVGLGRAACAVAQRRPRVVIVDERVEYSLLVRLGSRHPATGVLLLVQYPSHLLGTSPLDPGSCVASWRARQCSPTLEGASIDERPTAIVFAYVLECGPEDSILEDALARCEPHVAILGETAEPTIVERLRPIDGE